MTTHAYTEDQLVEQPAIGLFATLGWTTVSALEEIFGPAESPAHPSPPGRGSEGEVRPALLRETKSEVVLITLLRAALLRLNPSLPSEAINTAVDELVRDRSAMSLEAANREVYKLLKEGIRVSVADTEPSEPSPSVPSPIGKPKQG